VAYRSRYVLHQLLVPRHPCCPYYLDGDNCHHVRSSLARVSGVVGARTGLIDRRRAVTTVQFFRTAEEAGVIRVTSQNSAACTPAASARGARVRLLARPDPVDIQADQGVASGRRTRDNRVRAGVARFEQTPSARGAS